MNRFSHPLLQQISAALREKLAEMWSKGSMIVTRIREHRVTEEKPERAPETPRTDGPVSEQEAADRESPRKMLTLVLSYLLSCLVAAIVVFVQFSNTWGAPLGLALLVMFPIVPFFLGFVDIIYLLLWAFGFIFCWGIVSLLLGTIQNGGKDTQIDPHPPRH